jgi:hypothetical protein
LSGLRLRGTGKGSYESQSEPSNLTKSARVVSKREKVCTPIDLEAMICERDKAQCLPAMVRHQERLRLQKVIDSPQVLKSGLKPQKLNKLRQKRVRLLRDANAIPMGAAMTTKFRAKRRRRRDNTVERNRRENVERGRRLLKRQCEHQQTKDRQNGDNPV